MWFRIFKVILTYSGFNLCHWTIVCRGFVIMSCQCFVSDAPEPFLPKKIIFVKEKSLKIICNCKNSKIIFFHVFTFQRFLDILSYLTKIICIGCMFVHVWMYVCIRIQISIQDFEIMDQPIWIIKIKITELLIIYSSELFWIFHCEIALKIPNSS